jgi:hypothetical protein
MGSPCVCSMAAVTLRGTRSDLVNQLQYEEDREEDWGEENRELKRIEKKKIGEKRDTYYSRHYIK